MSQMPLLSGGELHVVEVTRPREKKLLAQYWGSSIGHFLATGDTSRLDQYHGMVVAGLPVDTDPDVIEDWYTSTDFDFQEIYEP